MDEKLQDMRPANEAEVARRIMVVGNHDYILRNVQGLLQRAGFETSGFTEVEEALDHLRYTPLDAVLIGGGVDPHVRSRISSLIRADFPHVKFIEHFGGPATILAEVKSALGLAGS